MKKTGKFIAALALVLSMCFSAAACGGNDGRTVVDFQFTGEFAVQEAFYACIDAYNDGQGKTDNVKVRAMPVPIKDNSSKLNTGLASSTGPDVAVARDRCFKQHAKNFMDISEGISADVLNGFYPEQEIRYHYNTESGTSNSSDPRYALPVYSDPTVLYYNKTALKAAGVICISVEEEDLQAYNEGTLKDKNGKTKSESGIPADFTVPNKGFYRENPFVPTDGVLDGVEWQLPASDELMIFNDSIACNWDEIEDVGLICTKLKNPSKATTKYGYYTEWWFNYGWSVGGDCVEDMSGNGDWVYTHADETPNYIVADGKTYTGAYTGTEYAAGETLDIKDILNAQKTDSISYKTENGTTFYYTVNGVRASVRPDVNSKTADGTLNELPSIKDAFKRFCYLSAKGGLGVCPFPSEFNSTTSASYFRSGQIAFLVEWISHFDTFDKNCNFEWGVARMPQYKVYNDPANPSDDSVKVKGVVASHSEGYGVGIRKNTRVKDAAVSFVEWLVSSGQKIFAERGFASVCKADVNYAADKIEQKYGVTNTAAVTDSLREAKPGDWWYLSDYAWIDIWSVPLNTELRYGKTTFDEYIYKYIDKTNELLKNY